MKIVEPTLRPISADGIPGIAVRSTNNLLAGWLRPRPLRQTPTQCQLKQFFSREFADRFNGKDVARDLAHPTWRNAHTGLVQRGRSLAAIVNYHRVRLTQPLGEVHPCRFDEG